MIAPTARMRMMLPASLHSANDQKLRCLMTDYMKQRKAEQMPVLDKSW